MSDDVLDAADAPEQRAVGPPQIFVFGLPPGLMAAVIDQQIQDPSTANNMSQLVQTQMILAWDQPTLNARCISALIGQFGVSQAQAQALIPSQMQFLGLVSNAVTSFNTRIGDIVLQSADVTTALGYTPYNSTNPSAYITTAQAAAAAPVQTVAGRSGAVTLTHNDITDWVAQLTPYALNSAIPVASTTPPGMDGTAVIGSATTFARADHTHPANTTQAPLASPAFTGVPTAPTQPVNDATNALATDAFVQAAVAPALNDTGRNLIHNAQFNVAQRGTGPWTTSNAYTLDRWLTNFSLDTNSFSQVGVGDTSRAQIGDEAATYCLGNTFTGNAGASAYTAIQQYIEDVRRTANKTVTVSFWASCASGALKLGVGLYQYFGTGGSPSATVTVPGQAVTLSTTWTRYSLTFSVPSVAGKTLGTNNNNSTQLSFWFSSGATNNANAGNIGVQSGTINIWGVQLEIGSVATPLAKRDPADDLALAQRFYQIGTIRLIGYQSAGGNAFGNYQALPVAMRAVPTITANYSAQTNGTGTVNPVDAQGAYAYITATAAGQVVLQGSFTASADL